jgi:uncharacterized protein (TIGR02099 family)
MRRSLPAAILHYAVVIGGTAVLLFAILVATVRLVLPDIGIYQGEIEGWVSRYTGYPVAIRSLKANWEGWVPTLHLANIDLLNKDGTRVLTHFESAQIRIAPLATLMARRFVPKRLEISGFDLTVTRLRSGAIHIAGLSGSANPDAALGENEIEEWLLQQDSITIRNGTIEWIDYLYDQEPLQLTGVTLQLRSDSDRVQLEGSANLPPSHGKSMEIAFDGFGDVVTANWSGELYVHASDVIAGRWYANYRPIDVQISGGSTDMTVWTAWNNAALTHVEGRLKHSNIAASVGTQSLQVQDLGYRFVAQRVDGGGWQLDLSLDNLLTEHGVWPEANVTVHAAPIAGGLQQRYEVGFDYLKLDDLAPLIARMQFLPEDVRNSVRRLAMSGDLRQGRIVFDPSQDPERQFAYDVRFENLSSRAFGGLPAIQAAAGHAAGNLAAGTVLLDKQSFRIPAPGAAEDMLDLDAVRGSVHWRKTAQGVDLNADRVDLRIADLELALSGTLSSSAGRPPHLEMAVAVGPTTLTSLIENLPVAPKAPFRDWLRRTVHAGEVRSAHAVLRGPLAAFPFDGPEGRFQAELALENVAFEYSPQWPMIEALHADLSIDGRQLTAGINGGRIFDAVIDSGTVTLDDVFAPQRLVRIAGTVHGGTRDLADFIDQSPLVNTATLARAASILTTGGIAMDLDMAIPVHMPGVTFRMDGQLRLHDAVVTGTHAPFALDNVNGTVAFTESTASGTGLSARFRGTEVSAEIAGSRADAGDPPALTLRGHGDRDWFARELRHLFPALAPWEEPFLRRVSGATDWELRISDPPGKTPGSLATRYLFRTDLQGVAIDLPAPLGKSAELPVQLEIERTLDGDAAGDLVMRYAGVLESRIAIAPGPRLRGAYVHFGPDAPLHAVEDGIALGGIIDQLDAQQWWPILRRDPDAPGAPATLDVRADLAVRDLLVLGRHFADVAVQAGHDAQHWEFNLRSAQLAGTVRLPAAFARESPVVMEFERLALLPRADAADAAPAQRLDPGTLPAFEISIGEFEYEGRSFGSARLAAAPIEGGLAIDPFRLQRPDLEIGGTGSWFQAGDGDRSRFELAVRADSLDEMLRTFGYDMAAVKNGATEIGVNGEWTGTPFEFALSRLDGTLDLKISKGQLLDVEPKAGRLFGLLSVTTLPRRLSLDFSDLFGKGLAFDVIEGRFRVKDGNAYTDDLSLRGPAANLAISGRTGLAAHDYDQLVTVTPQISDSLPVASVLFGPVGMGIGAVLFLANTLFESGGGGLDKLLRYQYTITGSWDDPIIEKHDSDAQASG